LAIGLTAAPQVQAQDMQKLEQLQREAEQIAQRAISRGGTYTSQEMNRLVQIQQEMVQAAGPLGGMMQTPPQASSSGGSPMLPPQVPPQTQPQQAVRQQGEHAGWPPASAFQNRFKLSPFRQPTGTTARYDAGENKGVIVSLEIYLTGGNTNTVLQHLKQQIEAAIGRQMSQDDNVYYGFIHDPNYKDESNLIRFRMELENNVVTLSINPVAG
jgi:hypothetical protein